MKNRFALVLALAVPTLPGCYFDLTDDGGDWTEPAPDRGYYGGEETALTVSDGALEGTFGTIAATGEARVQTAYSYSDYAYIELRARGVRGAVMAGLSINQGDISDLVVGETYVSSGDTWGGSAMFFSVLGCSGPSDGNWDYDRTSDEVTVQVEEGPEVGTITLRYTAEMPSSDWDSTESTTVAGSIVVAR